MLSSLKKRKKRKKKIKARIRGTADRLRLTVFRSNKYIYGQIINDQKGKTIAAASDLDLKGKKIMEKKEMTKKIAAAYEIGKILAKKAKTKGIEKVVYDRSGYRYHGRVKALAEGARQGGLKF